VPLDQFPEGSVRDKGPIAVDHQKDAFIFPFEGVQANTHGIPGPALLLLQNGLRVLGQDRLDKLGLMAYDDE
jgi:hypothetical protein